MKMALTGLLLREQAAKPLLESREVVITPVEHRCRDRPFGRCARPDPVGLSTGWPECTGSSDDARDPRPE
jgi:hypothetical protein